VTNIIDFDEVMYRSTSVTACFADTDTGLSRRLDRIDRWILWEFLRLMQLMNTTWQLSGRSAWKPHIYGMCYKQNFTDAWPTVTSLHTLHTSCPSKLPVVATSG